MNDRSIDPLNDQSDLDRNAIATSGPNTVPHAAISTGWFMACLMLGALYFLPAMLPFLFNVSSFAVGTVVSLAMFWFFYGMGWTPKRSAGMAGIGWLWTLAIAIFTILHLVVASQIATVDVGRALTSLAILMFMIVSAALLADTLFVIDDSALARAMTLLALLFFSFAALSIAGIQPPTQSIGEKPIFPYTEPSFFAFTFAPVLIYLCVSAPLWLRLVWLTATLTLALLLANLTLMFVVLLAAAVSLPLLVLAPSLVAAISFASLLDLSYFTDRIDFTLTSRNLSTLVYIQGWQLLEESLRDTMGWGLGFQQLGIGYTNVPASIRLNQLLGFDLNLTDGSFIFAKVGSEFGVFGVLLSAVCIYLAIKSFIALRFAPRGEERIPASLMLCHAILLGAIVELLVRGANYFTGSIVIFLSACFFLSRVKKSRLGERI